MSAAIANALAPTGRLRIALWTVPYLAAEQSGVLAGIVPDLGVEFARRIGVPADFLRCATPGALIEAFRSGAVDVTFVGVTAARAEAIDFGPVVLDIATSYLVPASSAIGTIADVDRADARILVPAASAQEAHLRKALAHATLIPVAPENPAGAIDLLAAGAAEAFSHVVPMLAAAQRDLRGGRILPGSTFNVPVAIGIAKGRPPAARDYARKYADNVKASGFVQQAIVRAGVIGIAVA